MPLHRIILTQAGVLGTLVLSQPYDSASQYDGLTLFTRQGTRVPLLHMIPLHQPRRVRQHIRHAQGMLSLASDSLYLSHAQQHTLFLPSTVTLTPISDALLVRHGAYTYSIHPRPLSSQHTRISTPYDARRHDTPAVEGIRITLPPGETRLTLYGNLPAHPSRIALPPPRKGLLAQAAWRTLRFLTTSLSAGYPWFPEHWYRDLTYVLPFLSREEQETLFSMLLQGVASLRSMPHSSVPAYDLPGILLFSLRHPHAHWLMRKHAKTLVASLTAAVRILLTARDTNNLIRAPHGATWMDTASRPYPIEVQAGCAAACRLLSRLTGEYVWLREAERIEQAVHEHYYHDGILFDDDPVTPTIRPNIFLAYHYHPDLFPRTTWQKIFHRVLPELMRTPFNGLYSTISIHHPAYHEEDDGLTSRAYHHGDSWYYLNLLILRALREVAPLTASLHAQSVLMALSTAAQTMDPPFLPEISSHSEPRAEGAWIQLWTAAAYAWLAWTPLMLRGYY